MKQLKNGAILKFYEFISPFLSHNIIQQDKLPGHSALLISAAAGDEAIGAAGTILSHISEGGQFTTLYCSQTTGKEVKESEKTALMLGSKVNHFLPFAKGSLSKSSKFPQSLAKAIEKINPDVVLIPSMMETNADNAAISEALVKIRKKIDLDFMIMAYSVWMPIMPNCIFDISKVWNEKKSVLDYCSILQTAQPAKDYVKVAEGINQYWGQSVSPNIKYAEAFLMATAQKYISMARKAL
ncbi:MAG: hypothetical protein LBB93_00420 [Elusimicrobiota bacterium]|nr:hypothetical protein [Elusimicrobiota bacterium]